MMHGKNLLRMNQTTIRQAIQDFLNNQLVTPTVVVTSVRATTGEAYNHSFPGFDVEISEKEPDVIS